MESKMKTYKTKSVKKLDKIFCDVCGALTTDDYGNHEHATIEAIWGYNSNQDGMRHEIHLCEKCFNDTIFYLKNKRSITPDKDPLNGESYFPI